MLYLHSGALGDWYDARKKMIKCRIQMDQKKLALELERAGLVNDKLVGGSNETERKASLLVMTEDAEKSVLEAKLAYLTALADERYLAKRLELLKAQTMFFTGIASGGTSAEGEWEEGMDDESG